MFNWSEIKTIIFLWSLKNQIWNLYRQGLQRATGSIKKCEKCDCKLRWILDYKVQQKELQSATGMTKCEEIAKSNGKAVKIPKNNYWAPEVIVTLSIHLNAFK